MDYLTWPLCCTQVIVGKLCSKCTAVICHYSQHVDHRPSCKPPPNWHQPLDHNVTHGTAGCRCFVIRQLLHCHTGDQGSNLVSLWIMQINCYKFKILVLHLNVLEWKLQLWSLILYSYKRVHVSDTIIYSILTDYGLDGRGSILDGGKNFLLVSWVQTASGANQASSGYRSPFMVVKRGRAWRWPLTPI